MKIRLALIALAAVAIPLSFVAAPYRRELVLQHIPTLLGLVLLGVAVVRFRLSDVSFYCCFAFLWLHLIGARWIYSFVPYDAWSVAICGHAISDIFGWQRNHYDRLVHFASGLLGVPIFAEALRVFCRTNVRDSAILGLTCVLAVGAVYEVFEWRIAMHFSPEMAESYNGQQGDIWDAQKDLAMALLGGLILLGSWWAYGLLRRPLWGKSSEQQ
ncbi:DUF2238 domain-containing protein [Planctomycetaceae bacterium SH139]